MSNDEKVTKRLISVLEDGSKGFTDAAEHLTKSSEPQLAATFGRYADQRATFAAELSTLAAEYGDNIHESGSVAGALHRGWINIKDALTGSSPEAVLGAARTGENHTVEEFDEALAEDLSPTLKAIIVRQADAVQAARDTVASLKLAADQ